MTVVDSGTISSGLDSLNRRFVSIAFLPLAAACAFVFAVVCSGAPHRIDPGRAVHLVSHASASAVLAALGTLVTIAVVMYPLQAQLVRALEGYLPRWMGPAAALGRAIQHRRRNKLVDSSQLPADLSGADADDLIQAAGQAGQRLRQRYPDRATLMPTGLGNALAAAEERAGAAYGWDAVVFWPRLYPLLPTNTRAIVDDRRNRLDSMANFTVAFAIATVATGCLTAGIGLWLLVSLIPMVLSVLAYSGAITAGVAYGEALTVAIDLHRFMLYESLRVGVPATSDDECVLADTLALQWRQGYRPVWTYVDGRRIDGGLPYQPAAPDAESETSNRTPD